MKTLELPAGAKKFRAADDAKFEFSENKVMETSAENPKSAAATKIRNHWFSAASPENLSTTGAVIRGLLVILMPMLSAVDWNYGTHTLFYIAPVIFYLEVTAFTMFCPIKALFSNYGHPSRYE